MGKKANRLGMAASYGLARTGREKPRGPVLLACEKCEERLAKEGRFRQIAQLRQELDALAVEAHASESGLQILPVSCLDVCPRGAMAVAVGAVRGRGPAETLIVRTPQELRTICVDLMKGSAKATPASTSLPGVEEQTDLSTPDSLL